jgi:hypothetical protein
MDRDKILQELIAERDRLDKAIAALQETTPTAKPKNGRKKRAPMSQAARDKIAAAQKKRWQKAKKAE